EEVTDPLLRDDLKHCFARDPDKRFAAAKQLADNLRSLNERHVALALQEAATAARERAAYRRGIVRATAVALLVVGLVASLAFFAFAQARHATRARDEARATLSKYDLLQALRSINEDKDSDAIVQLPHSLSLKPDNEAARYRLVTLLTYRNLALPVASVRHSEKITSARFSPDGKRILTASVD